MSIIFRAEVNAGLRERIAVSSAAISTVVFPASPFHLDASTRASLLTTKASVEESDLFFMRGTFASTGWGPNDDVIEPLDLFEARTTPIHKPIHLGTDQSKIVGQIATVELFKPDGAAVPSDCLIESLPSNFSLTTGSVLWTIWENQNRQKEVEAALDEIAKGEYRADFACRFGLFDYALAKSGGYDIVARDASTAHMSQHLKAYGGDGTFEGRKIGRMLRRITFSGLGLIPDPGAKARAVAADRSAKVAADIARCFT